MIDAGRSIVCITSFRLGLLPDELVEPILFVLLLISAEALAARAETIWIVASSDTVKMNRAVGVRYIAFSRGES